jgi:DNA-binding NtrC family response regulator
MQSTPAIRQPSHDRVPATGIVTPGRFGEPDSARGDIAPAIIKSRAMESVVTDAEAVAKTDATVLITGESGVGKDVLARFIHFNSKCAPLNMITVNCGAFVSTLFESEFFGHEKGAFTGANTSRIGLLEAADGSTLFLDEIGDLDPLMQVKLLRFLEDGTFRRVGSTSDRRAIVRIIAATNKNLELAIREGTFRADLYYRLNVVTLNVPPLRERREEIPQLAETFMTTFRSRFKRPHLSLSNEARRSLQNYNWPGNVRQLRNSLERACALSLDDLITEAQLTSSEENSLRLITESNVPDNSPAISHHPLSLVGQNLTLDELERAHIKSILVQTKANREKAAAVLGISSRTLYRKIKEYRLEEDQHLDGR